MLRSRGGNPVMGGGVSVRSVAGELAVILLDLFQVTREGFAICGRDVRKKLLLCNALVLSLEDNGSHIASNGSEAPAVAQAESAPIRDVRLVMRHGSGPEAGIG